MKRAGWIVAGLVAGLHAGIGLASPVSWPECRAAVQDLLAANTVAFRASREGDELRYVLRIDAERWNGLGLEGQDALQAQLSCSISAGGDPVPYSLSVRSAYSNRELARYHDGVRLARAATSQGEPNHDPDP